MQQLNCPSCGAPLPVENRFVKMVTCDFCGQVSLLKSGALEGTGTVATLTELPSKLFLDATGTLKGRRFRAIGRLQYAYEDGFWHEWFVTLGDDDRGWLQEDEGRFTLYQKETLTTPAPPYDQVRVGQTLQVGGREVFVTEKGEAQIVGGEGQLAFAILPGETVYYVDGTSDGAQVSLEYAADEIEWMVGEAVPHDDVQVDEPDYF